MKASKRSSILGIALRNEKLTAVWLRRSGNGIVVRKALSAPLSLDLLNSDPALAGREIRNHLDSAGISERHCVVAVPLKWALVQKTKLPDLSGEDMDSYLAVQAERGFPLAPDDLSIAVSPFKTQSGDRHATMVAIPKSHVVILNRILQAAKLRPLSITPAITSLTSDAGGMEEGSVTLLAGKMSIDLAIHAGGGLVALRMLDAAISPEPDGSNLDVSMIARELRITLGQLPPDLRATLRKVEIVGRRDMIEPLQLALLQPLSELGLAVEHGRPKIEKQIKDCSSIAKMDPDAVGIGVRFLLGGSRGFEFLPPRVSRLKQLTGRISSRSTLVFGSAAALLVIGLIAAFSYQHFRLTSLESKWAGIEEKVGELKTLQTNIRSYRPWFDDSAPSLSIASSLTQAFPQEGSLWAKKIVITNQAQVECTGNARSEHQWLDMRDNLMKADGIDELQVLSVQGNDPLKFRFKFNWKAGNKNES
jgi:hypothetical protein